MIVAPDPELRRDALLDGRALRVVHRAEGGRHVATRGFPPGAGQKAFRHERAATAPAAPLPGVVHLLEAAWR